MISHPAVLNAAAALLCGWDPLAYLRVAGTDRLVADAVLEVAHRNRLEELELLAKLVGHHVAAAFAGG